MKLSSRRRVAIKSFNQEKLFNKLLTLKIEVFNITRKDNITTFDIADKQFKQLLAVLQQNGIEILSQQKQGIAYFGSFMLARIGILCAVFLMLACLILSNFFILKININGCDKISSFAVKNFLASQNIATFSSKKNFDTSKIELLIMQEFEQISLVSASIIGCSLVVNIKEKAEDFSLLGQDIISDFNGRITSIEVVSGVSKIQVGQLVKENDVLVEGGVDLNGNKTPARAKITAEVWLVAEMTVPNQSIVLVPTGKVQAFRQVEAWDKVLYSNIAEPKFENYRQTKKETTKLSSILPLKITNLIYEEVEEVVETVDFDVNKEKFIDECRQNALQNALKNDIIISEKYYVNSEANNNFIQYVIVAERNILWR